MKLIKKIKKATRDVFFFTLVSYKCLSHGKSLGVLTNLNPSIPFGGLGRLSKSFIINQLNQKSYSEYFPKQILLETSQVIEERLKKAEIFVSKTKFPIVAKPDVGFTGIGVNVFNNKEDLLTFLSKQKVDYLLEEFCPHNHELGVYYLKLPGQKKGKVIGVVEKDFPFIIADGKKTINELAGNVDEFVKAYLINKYNYLENIPKKDTIINLIGKSHATGEQIPIDRTHELNEKFSQVIESISSQIPDLYYGRYDIKISKWPLTNDDLNFQILELNPSIDAIPLHFYDKKYSFFQKYKSVLKLLDTAVKISSQNKPNNKNSIGFFGLMKEQVKLVRHLKKI
ncbi:hypothetical protein HN695_00600 [Candidatus Woesearchaeota archaeon]|jgi:hypothetical protein|nr:hypothetical protein [Candidatus Woesearchaeota archaeon]MBT5272828.1 hypothetical protein [Candidatus Woesearchaeota archaeon]MBT6040440.1 hypothetical protein [Candidatus Woesearchaeota archaeon]MBT6336927.1 hypothetical protein [Candidatus Woesearchaeota archaeon]MBT7926813.1 hypothetical protein [Candidatus Woesearchaeota archaeon]